MINGVQIVIKLYISKFWFFFIYFLLYMPD